MFHERMAINSFEGVSFAPSHRLAVCGEMGA